MILPKLGASIKKLWIGNCGLTYKGVEYISEGSLRNIA